MGRCDASVNQSTRLTLTSRYWRRSTTTTLITRWKPRSRRCNPPPRPRASRRSPTPMREAPWNNSLGGHPVDLSASAPICVQQWGTTNGWMGAGGSCPFRNGDPGVLPREKFWKFYMPNRTFGGTFVQYCPTEWVHFVVLNPDVEAFLNRLSY